MRGMISPAQGRSHPCVIVQFAVGDAAPRKNDSWYMYVDLACSVRQYIFLVLSMYIYVSAHAGYIRSKTRASQKTLYCIKLYTISARLFSLIEIITECCWNQLWNCENKKWKWLKYCWIYFSINNTFFLCTKMFWIL